MAHAFYMDVHIPSAITDGLRRRGIDVLTSQEDGTTTALDPDLLARATDLDRILFTQDDDFLAIASEWQGEGREFAGVVYGHQLTTSIGQCVGDLELIATCCEENETRNQVIYLPLD